METPIAVDIPSAFRGRVDTIAVEIYPVTAGACRELLSFNVAGCAEQGGECTAWDRAPLGAPQSTAMTARTNGTFAPLAVELGDGTSWQAVVIASMGPSANDLLYGCAEIEAGTAATIRLGAPYCAGAAACARSLPLECRPRIVCAGIELVEDLADPPCEAEDPEEIVEVWADERGPCPPPDGAPWKGACTPAMRACVEDAAPFGGVCPDLDAVERCVSADDPFDAADDLDCDGALPSCGPGACDPGSTECVADVRCAPLCSRDGTFVECTGVVEVCNASDDDCDSDIDEPPAAASCSPGRARNALLADGCDGPASDPCTCGGGPACGDREACCSGVCVSIADDERHCGSCTTSCDVGRGELCRGGNCLVPPDAGTVDAGAIDAGPARCDLAGCNVGRTIDAPAARSCDATGACMCGATRACTGGAGCCPGETGRFACVDLASDAEHCGVCSRDCAGLRCVRGECVR